MNIKLFASYRVDLNSKVIKNNIITPVYCGSVYKENEWNKNIIGDNTGDNISKKRMSFCELTVQYWAWKNIKADYYGLCHYRRFLAFTEDEHSYRNEQNQIYLPNLNDYNINKYSIANVDKIEKYCKKYDVIIPEPADIKKITSFGKHFDTVLELWQAHDKYFFDKKVLDILIDSIKKYKPHYYKYAVEYLNSNKHRGYNCYILKKELFNELCEFQFPILFKIENDLSKSEFLNKYPRTIGYLGEILYGVFIYSLIKSNIKIKEIPLIIFENTNTDISIIEKVKLYLKYNLKKFVRLYLPDIAQKYLKIIYHKFK